MQLCVNLNKRHATNREMQEVYLDVFRQETSLARVPASNPFPNNYADS